MPDYITVDIAGFSPWIAGGGAVFTLTRDGSLFIGPQGGAGTLGGSAALRAGWIGRSHGRQLSGDDINSFVHAGSASVNGDASCFGPVMCSFGWTWGNPGGFTAEDSAFEAGVSGGTPGFAGTGSYSWHAADLPVGW